MEYVFNGFRIRIQYLYKICGLELIHDKITFLGTKLELSPHNSIYHSSNNMLDFRCDP